MSERNDLARSGLSRFAAIVRNSYINRRYGGRRQPTSDWAWLLMYLLPPPLRLEWDHYMRHLPRPVPGRNRLLDVGCGNGDFLLRAQHAGWTVHGLDFDPTAAGVARGRGLDVYVGTLEDSPFLEESFDVVTANQVVEHVHDPVAFLRACWRLVRPGGLLWIGTPNVTPPVAARFGPFWPMLEIPRHLTLFSLDSLDFAFRNAGIASPQYKPRGWCIAGVMQDSTNIKNGAVAGSVTSIHPGIALRGAMHEAVAWVEPTCGVELIAIAHKPG